MAFLVTGAAIHTLVDLFPFSDFGVAAGPIKAAKFFKSCFEINLVAVQKVLSPT
jgi:hypothetical protein